MNARIGNWTGRLWTALWLLTGSATAAFSQDVVLRHRWTTGETVRMRSTSHVRSSFSGLPGGTTLIEVTFGQMLSVDTIEVSTDGTAKIRCTIESLRMQGTTPDETFTYDSTASDPAAAPEKAAAFEAAFSAMVGQSFDAVIAPDGKVLKIDGAKAIMERFLDRAGLDSSARTTMHGFIDQSGDRTWQGALEQSFQAFPDKPVVPGDSWDSERTVFNPASGSLITHFTLESIDDHGGEQIATIGSTLGPASLAPNTPAALPGVAVKFDTLSSQGTLTFNVTTGRLQRFVTRTESSMKLPAPGGDPATANARMKIEQELTVELLPVAQ
jgi:hypothetical protein